MSNKKHRRPGHGKFGKLTDTAGNSYDFDKNTVNGLPPLQVGDEFYYRATVSSAAAVHMVRVINLVGKIGLLDLINPEGVEPNVYGSIMVDLTRIEVVQMVEKPKPATTDAPDHPATAPDPSTYTQEQRDALDRQRNVGNAAGPEGTAEGLTAEKLAEAKKILDANPVPFEDRKELNAEADNLAKVDAALTEEAKTEKKSEDQGEAGPGSID